MTKTAACVYDQVAGEFAAFTIHWDYETRLIHAIAAVIHVEIVEDESDV